MQEKAKKPLLSKEMGFAGKMPEKGLKRPIFGFCDQKIPKDANAF